LHRFQPALIVCKLDRWMLGDLGQHRALNDNKIFGLHAQVNAEPNWLCLDRDQMRSASGYVAVWVIETANSGSVCCTEIPFAKSALRLRFGVDPSTVQRINRPFDDVAA
jgi:hypothetical protein